MNKTMRITGIIALFVYITLTVSLTGCTRGIKEGLYSIKGSSGKFHLIGVNHNKLGDIAYEYGSCRIEPFSNDVGDLCPQEFIDRLPGAISEQIVYRPRTFKDKMKRKSEDDMGPFFTGSPDKKLIVRGKIIQYDITEKGARGLVTKVLGSYEVAICRVQIVDADSGSLIAEANCTGSTKSAIRTGPAELANGIGKAIRKMLKPNNNK